MGEDRDDESDLTIAAAALASSANAVTEVGAELREVRAAVSQTGERVASLGRRIDGLEWRADNRQHEMLTAVSKLTEDVRAATTRREITPVRVAPVPSRRRGRAFTAGVGATAALLLVALGVLIWRACSGSRPIGLAELDDAVEVDARPRPRADAGVRPPKGAPPRPRRDPSDTTVDPDDEPADTDRGGCAGEAGLPEWRRSPRCRVR